MLRHQTSQLLQDSTDIPAQKNFQKNLSETELRHQKHSSVPSINSNQDYWNEPTRDSKIKTNRPNAPTNRLDTTIIGESMITNVFGDKLSININMTVNIMLQLNNKHQ